MKTAMQELWDYIDANYHEDTFNLYDAKEISLKEEKEQIVHTYWVAYKEGRYSGDKTAEDYYNETFNQDSELPKEDKTFKQKSKWTKL